jgi:uncharacterized LabA/DUF88 family protein
MKRVFKRSKPTGNYAFIDSQNLNLGIQRAGWKLDWKKFRIYLKENYDVDKAFMFIGYLPENEDLYSQMQAAGYLVALKPTLEMLNTSSEDKKDEKEKIPTKGNVDAELVMYAMKELPNYRKAIIVSGDGDFYSLIEYLLERKKLLCVMTPNWRYSTLLKPFERSIVRLDTLKSQLAYRTTYHQKKKRDKTHIDHQNESAHNHTS